MNTLRCLTTIFFLCLFHHSFGQQLAGSQVAMYTEVKEGVKDLCNSTRVYLLYMMKQFPSSNAVEGKFPVSETELLQLLNEKTNYLKENPKYKGKFSVRVIVNCKGELIICNLEKKTRSDDFNKQILEVFTSLKGWAPGEFNGEIVDSTKSFYFKIKNGEIQMEF
jgi:uncharacterized protein (DUF2147 family)